MYPQRAESAALVGALWRGGHQKHREWCLHLQDHLCQGQDTHTFSQSLVHLWLLLQLVRKMHMDCFCPLLLFNHMTLFSPYSSLATGAQTTVRMKCRVWFWTRLERWFIVLEASGTRASSVTPCLHQNASGSQVSSIPSTLSTGKVLKSPDKFRCWPRV